MADADDVMVADIVTTTSVTRTDTQHVMIDNRQTIYIPIRLHCGITVMCHADLWNQSQHSHEHWLRRIRTILQTDVSYCLQILPRSVRSLIRRTKIWLNGSNYCYLDPQQQQQQSLPKQPIYVNHTTTHHDVAWLLWYVFSLFFFLLLGRFIRFADIRSV